jgi:hypothetical protein
MSEPGAVAGAAAGRFFCIKDRPESNLVSGQLLNKGWDGPLASRVDIKPVPFPTGHSGFAFFDPGKEPLAAILRRTNDKDPIGCDTPEERLIATAEKMEKMEEYRSGIWSAPWPTGKALATQPKLFAEILLGMRNEDTNAITAVAAALTYGSDATYVELANSDPDRVRPAIEDWAPILSPGILDSPQKLRVALAAMKGATNHVLTRNFDESILKNMNEEQFSIIASSPDLLEGLAVLAARLAYPNVEDRTAVQQLKGVLMDPAGREALRRSPSDGRIVGQLLKTEAGRKVLGKDPDQWPQYAHNSALKR